MFILDPEFLFGGKDLIQELHLVQNLRKLLILPAALFLCVCFLKVILEIVTLAPTRRQTGARATKGWTSEGETQPS